MAVAASRHLERPRAPHALQRVARAVRARAAALVAAAHHALLHRHRHALQSGGEVIGGDARAVACTTNGFHRGVGGGREDVFGVILLHLLLVVDSLDILRFVVLIVRAAAVIELARRVRFIVRRSLEGLKEPVNHVAAASLTSGPDFGFGELEQRPLGPHHPHLLDAAHERQAALEVRQEVRKLEYFRSPWTRYSSFFLAAFAAVLSALVRPVTAVTRPRVFAVVRLVLTEGLGRGLALFLGTAKAQETSSLTSVPTMETLPPSLRLAKGGRGST